MRLLANENFPRLAVQALRDAGRDVAWVAEDCPSIADRAVLALAVREGRVLVTQDKDFGELAFRSQLPAACGVVLFRMAPRPAEIAAAAVEVLARPGLEGRFVVVEEGLVRDRPLPRPRDVEEP